MIRLKNALLPLIGLATLALTGQELVVVTKDDTIIDKSCRIEIPEGTVIPDANGNGVIHIKADDISVYFTKGSVLRGASADTPLDELKGYGVRVDGHKAVRISGLVAHGYKAGVFLSRSSESVVERCDFSGNFAQRLKSTAKEPAKADWLVPHENDDNQWLENYGAAVYAEESEKLTLRNIKVRKGQNGIVLDRVSKSRIYDNDCSFLSGWGLAMWRSSENAITRNAFDFCIRGYSHGVYNRGQDSAGILMFEQCNENIIAENTATHSGDGILGFAGREALGQTPKEGFDYKGKGNNGNIIANNNFSWAAAHGVEMTFSFQNTIYNNQFTGNAICGVWAGYSQDSLIAKNEFKNNGDMGYGSERGGVNIEHGANNVIRDNQFERNKCGVFLWSDEDAELLATPWAKANHQGSVNNTIAFNMFEGDEIAIQMKASPSTTVYKNFFRGVGQVMDEDKASKPVAAENLSTVVKKPRLRVYGGKTPKQDRLDLAGRDKIVMTEWGPLDQEAEAKKSN